MSISSILKLALVALLIAALFITPFDLNLSIGNKNDDDNTDIELPSDSDNGNENDGTNDSNGENEGENGDTNDGNEGENGNENNPPVPSIVTEAHDYNIYCEECQVGECYNSGRFNTCYEDYGSIGFCVYDVYCIYCNSSCFGLDIRHNYVDGTGVCTAEGCAHECDHTFTYMGLSTIVPWDDRFSMFDPYELFEGASSVHEGVCTICGKQGL